MSETGTTSEANFFISLAMDIANSTALAVSIGVYSSTGFKGATFFTIFGGTRFFTFSAEVSAMSAAGFASTDGFPTGFFSFLLAMVCILSFYSEE